MAEDTKVNEILETLQEIQRLMGNTKTAVERINECVQLLQNKTNAEAAIALLEIINNKISSVMKTLANDSAGSSSLEETNISKDASSVD